jgi:hypothetical protein
MPRAIPDDNLAYPVLLAIQQGGFGSGFFLNTSHSLFLVTAKHVVFNPTTKALVGTECSLLSYPRDPSEAGTNEFRLDLAKLNSDGNIKSHSGADIAIVKIANVNRQGAAALLAGVSAISSAPSGILGVAEANIKRFAEVLIANEVFIFGYPTSLGLKAIAQLDYAKPLLRRGIVAGKNDGLQTLVLDCPVYWGNSGGPVLEVETVDLTTKRFSVVGVVSQFVPLVETWRNQTHGYENLDVSNSGYSVATPMDPVMELVSMFAVNPGRSTV